MLGLSAVAIGGATEGLISDDSHFHHTIEVSVGRIEPDPEQPRRSFDEVGIAALAETLKAEGQLQPVLLRRHPERQGYWVIVAGERRWRAAKLLGWPKMLAMDYGGDAEVAALVENLQRVDLTPVEEARGVGRLIKEKGWTQEQAAQALGKPKSDISGTLRILNIPEDMLQQVLTSEHPPAKNVLVEMARIDDPVTLRKLVEYARAGTLTVRTLREMRSTTSASLPSRDSSRTRVTSPWRFVRKACHVVSAMAASGQVVSSVDAQLLRDLHTAIDRLLSESRQERQQGS